MTFVPKVDYEYKLTMPYRGYDRIYIDTVRDRVGTLLANGSGTSWRVTIKWDRAAAGEDATIEVLNNKTVNLILYKINEDGNPQKIGTRQLRLGPSNYNGGRRSVKKSRKLRKRSRRLSKNRITH